MPSSGVIFMSLYITYRIDLLSEWLSRMFYCHWSLITNRSLENVCVAAFVAPDPLTSHNKQADDTALQTLHCTALPCPSRPPFKHCTALSLATTLQTLHCLVPRDRPSNTALHCLVPRDRPSNTALHWTILTTPQSTILQLEYSRLREGRGLLCTNGDIIERIAHKGIKWMVWRWHLVLCY